MWPIVPRWTMIMLSMKSTLCTRLIESVDALAMASFFVGLFMTVLNIASWCLIHRLEHGAEKSAKQCDGH